MTWPQDLIFPCMGLGDCSAANITLIITKTATAVTAIIRSLMIRKTQRCLIGNISKRAIILIYIKTNVIYRWDLHLTALLPKKNLKGLKTATKPKQRFIRSFSAVR